MPLMLKYTSVYTFLKSVFSPTSAQYNQSIEPVQILPAFPSISLFYFWSRIQIQDHTLHLVAMPLYSPFVCYSCSVSLSSMPLKF